MAEYWVHLTNIPVDAESPQAAAREIRSWFKDSEETLLTYVVSTETVGLATAGSAWTIEPEEISGEGQMSETNFYDEAAERANYILSHPET
jgi:hypothetical protein